MEFSSDWHCGVGRLRWSVRVHYGDQTSGRIQRLTLPHSRFEVVGMTEESRRGRARVPAGYSCGTAHIPVSTPGTAAPRKN